MVSLPHMMGRLNWAHQRSLASPASYVYPKDAKAEGRGEHGTPLASALIWRASMGRELWAGFKTGERPGGKEDE